MIEESYVSFDTARMLKEAGFDVPCECYYSWFDGKPIKGYCDGKVNHNRDKSEDADISRPTQDLAARWLREKYRFHVYCLQTNLPLTEPKTDKWEWGYIIARVDDPNEEVAYDMNFPNYEAALEAGIVKCLELLRF